jgi:hypothetical protein
MKETECRTQDRWPRGRLNSFVFAGNLPRTKGKPRGPAEVNASIDRQLTEGRKKIEAEFGVRIRDKDLWPTK